MPPPELPPVRRWYLPALGTAAVLACASPQSVDPDIVRPAPGAPLLDALPGPLLVFGSYQSALLTACQKIVTKPNATAGRKELQGFDARWRAGTEYCAWIYYTPDEKYVLSKLTDQTKAPRDAVNKTCHLPPRVDDPRFPPGSIQYVYALHNHLYDDVLSSKDLDFILAVGVEHGFGIETKDGSAKLSIVAFFSHEAGAPRCDGFYQYIPSSKQVLKWTHEKKWTCRQTHIVEWDAELSTTLIARDAPCTGGTNP